MTEDRDELLAALLAERFPSAKDYRPMPSPRWLPHLPPVENPVDTGHLTLSEGACGPRIGMSA